jgi:hypothetical protein
MNRTAGLHTPINCSYVTVSADVLDIAGGDWRIALVLHVFLDRFQRECDWLEMERDFDGNPWMEMTHRDISRETMRFVPVDDVGRCVAYLIGEDLIEKDGDRYRLNAFEFNRRSRSIAPQTLDYGEPTLFDMQGAS